MYLHWFFIGQTQFFFDFLIDTFVFSMNFLATQPPVGGMGELELGGWPEIVSCFFGYFAFFVFSRPGEVEASCPPSSLPASSGGGMGKLELGGWPVIVFLVYLFFRVFSLFFGVRVDKDQNRMLPGPYFLQGKTKILMIVHELATTTICDLCGQGQAKRLQQQQA